MYKRTLLVSTLALTSAIALPASLPTLRPSPDLTVTEPAGHHVSLADCRGKVVIVQFLYTTCQHCAATARMLTKLQADFSPRDLQVVGAAFNDEAQNPSAIRDFIRQNSVSFPVGAISTSAALGYLRIPVITRFVVPQLVIIDHGGVIRVQSAPSAHLSSRMKPICANSFKNC